MDEKIQIQLDWGTDDGPGKGFGGPVPRDFKEEVRAEWPNLVEEETPGYTISPEINSRDRFDVVLESLILASDLDPTEIGESLHDHANDMDEMMSKE